MRLDLDSGHRYLVEVECEETHSYFHFFLVFGAVSLLESLNIGVVVKLKIK